MLGILACTVTKGAKGERSPRPTQFQEIINFFEEQLERSLDTEEKDGLIFILNNEKYEERLTEFERQYNNPSVQEDKKKSEKAYNRERSKIYKNI